MIEEDKNVLTVVMVPELLIATELLSLEDYVVLAAMIKVIYTTSN